MTLVEVNELFAHWRKYPPAHRLIAWEIGFEPQYTGEELIKQGAMGPEDFLLHFKATKGKLPE